MTEQEKAISQLCIAMQECCNNLREDYDILDDSNTLYCIEDCIEKIHRIVNPDFNKICEDIEAFERSIWTDDVGSENEQ